MPKIITNIHDSVIPMRRAFVSHSTRDDSYVAELESFLRAAGFDDVFNDVRSIQPDEEAWLVIEQGITDCDTFVVVITAASNASTWVKREVEFARGLSKHVIPVWIEDCQTPQWFADRDVIDFRPHTHAERRFDISRILKYAPAELIGREAETKLLNDTWAKVLLAETPRPHILTFVALGGEGKTSLVAKWAAELAGQDWPGCDAAFAWSFYSQGTHEQQAASSDLFLKEALKFFGDDADQEFAASNAGAYEKGQRLAKIVGQRRSLLILDGLEPLQYSPTSPTPGELKDQGIAALLKGLAQNSRGMCVVTTRYSIPDLKTFRQTTAPEKELLRLSKDAGVALLKNLGVKTGSREDFEKLVEDVDGHALTLQIMGGFLKKAYNGDIRCRDRVKFEKADTKIQGGHAFRAMKAYVDWMEEESDEARRELAILRILGLFDRPATADCVNALLKPPAIPKFTEPLVGVSEEDWNISLDALETAKLLTVHRDTAGTLISLDAHPLIREYFARQLRTQQPDAWRVAHRRLYEHLTTNTPDKDEPTLEDLQPLYQAVAHGCQAGLQQEACDKVYYARIMRRNEYYSVRKLGAFASDLGAVACFFETPWSRMSRALKETNQSVLMNSAAAWLRALGRLTEALEPMRVSGEMDVSVMEWKGAATSYSNLSELELTLGEVAGAVGDAEQSVTYADRSGDTFERESDRGLLADVLHQAGRHDAALTLLREVEVMQAKRTPDYPLCFSLRGFRYCDLLLAVPERAAWQTILQLGTRNTELRTAAASCPSVSKRAAQTLKWVESWQKDILSASLDHLTLGRAALYEAIIRRGTLQRAPTIAPTTNDWNEAREQINAAVDGFRRAGTMDHLPRGILTRAWLYYIEQDPAGAGLCLDEAWEIAERGPMRLHMADIHLHRARLFFREDKYPWESPASDLAAAEKLINTCGYHRRDEELADVKKAILNL